MKALVKTDYGFGHLEIQDKPEPIPAAEQVKIKVRYAGICGTDLHTYEGHYKVGVPVTLGHEFSGDVVEIGEAVTSVAVGDRVTSETTYSICGECEYCQTKDYNLCSQRKGLGTQQDGGFTNYLIAREASVHKLPDGVDYKAASMTEPLACTYHAVEKTEVNQGDIVVVLGPGAIGLLTAQVAKSKGAKVIITGLNSDKIRLEKAKELGIDYVINIQEENLKDVVDGITGGYGADIVYECSGAVPAAKQGLDLLRKKGQYCQVGIFATPEIPFDLEKIVQKEIRVVGTRSQKHADWQPSLELLNRGDVNAKALVTHEYDITQWEEAYQAIKSGEAIKVLLTPVNEG
ncbi:zinc-binding dehydrogenase [Shouchella sp. 1P09AA]|uniref:zinc-binding dehydrogenase n=1 Tax=unclassified Shouchella TaxID=2893065 RepID=UPI0039A033A5